MIDDRMQNDPSLLLPKNLPEEVFDIAFVEAHTLLSSIGSDEERKLKVVYIANFVSDILRLHEIYDIYKDNIGSLVVLYASWIVLESLKRSGEIEFDSVGFDKIFDNDTLMQVIEAHKEAFEKALVHQEAISLS